MVLDSTNKQLDCLTRETQDLKTSLQLSEVDELKQAQAQTSEHRQKLQADLTSIEESALNTSNKMDYTENQSRWNNIIIDGVTGSQNEKWTETKKEVRNLLTERMKIDQHHAEIECAHRLEKPSASGNKP